MQAVACYRQPSPNPCPGSSPDTQRRRAGRTEPVFSSAHCPQGVHRTSKWSSHRSPVFIRHRLKRLLYTECCLDSVLPDLSEALILKILQCLTNAARRAALRSLPRPDYKGGLAVEADQHMGRCLCMLGSPAQSDMLLPTSADARPHLLSPTKPPRSPCPCSCLT